jgi:hypothetical protein
MEIIHQQNQSWQTFILQNSWFHNKKTFQKGVSKSKNKLRTLTTCEASQISQELSNKIKSVAAYKE